MWNRRSQRTVGYFVNFIEHLEQKLFLELLEFGYFLVKAGAHVDDQIAFLEGENTISVNTETQ